MDGEFDQGGFVLAKHYRLLDKLGEGSFGQLYECEDIQTKKQFAAKLEPIQESQSSQLRYQAKIYQILQGSSTPFDYVRRHLQNIRVGSAGHLQLPDHGEAECLPGPAARQIERQIFAQDDAHGRRPAGQPAGVPAHEGVRASGSEAQQLHARVRGEAQDHLHHRLRAGQAVYGLQDQRAHQSEDREVAGRDCSVRQHRLARGHRRDDLESLGYLLLYFVRGCLPWQGIQTKKKIDKFDSIGNMKKTTPLNKLCEGYEDLENYLSYVRQLSFTEQPDYNLIRKIFRQSFVSRGYQPDYFEWQLPLQVNGQKPVPNKPLTKKPF